jgi:hypothetical protein
MQAATAMTQAERLRRIDALADGIRERVHSERSSRVSSTGATGLEPATSGVTGRRSNQLSYAPERVGMASVAGDRHSSPPRPYGAGAADANASYPTLTVSTPAPSPWERKSPLHCATKRFAPRRTRQLVVYAPLELVLAVRCCQWLEPGGR